MHLVYPTGGKETFLTLGGTPPGTSTTDSLIFAVVQVITAAVFGISNQVHPLSRAKSNALFHAFTDFALVPGHYNQPPLTHMTRFLAFLLTLGRQYGL